MLIDGRANEFGGDVERFQLDELADRQVAVAEPLQADDIIRRDAERAQLDKAVARAIGVSDASKTGDPIGGDAERQCSASHNVPRRRHRRCRGAH